MKKPIKKAKDFEELRKEEDKAKWIKFWNEMDRQATNDVYRRFFVNDKMR